ncbi:E3 ubiquitin-protein ligase TOM1-like protein [Botrytis cinerea]
MVRIIKTIQPKHVETLSPFINDFGKTACSISLPLLPQHLAQFPTRWPFPRGDLYHWISLLNRFDVILERFCTTYKLADGPQKVDFGCEMLKSNVGAAADDTKTYDLLELGYGEDGDRQLIEAILKFSKMLLENCGNRSIYSSSPHLGSLLNTTSLSLLENTLLVTSQLAQRYNSAMKRIGSARSTKHLLAEHYNIDLNRVLQLALPFSKTTTSSPGSGHPTTPNPTTPGAKGKEKEKAYFNLPVSPKNSTTVVYANDLVSIYKGGSGVSTNTKSPRRSSVNTASPQSQASWDEWGDVKMTYYPKAKTESEPANTALKPVETVATPSGQPPVTPTPVRRSSNLGPNAQRANRATTTEETSPVLARTPTMPADDAQRQNAKTIEISSAKLRSTDIYSLMEEYSLDLPQDLQYELFTKIRIAKALISSLETRQQALVIRMLAVANMANVYTEPVFLENIMKQDSDEPKRLQFIYQVADLVHPPAEGDIAVSTYMQTLAFSTLEAIAGISSKFQDVCKALNTTINHGVMLYVIRKAVAEMAVEDLGDKLTEKDQWRNALFSLMTSLCQYPRTAEGLVTAGLIPIMIEILGLRTTVAQRYQPKTLSFLDNVVYSAREAFQILVNANGLDRVSDLIVHETTVASGIAESGNVMPVEHRSPSTDYEVPFYQQQILKWLFKFIHHMMSSANSYGGNFDRILRNLIDSSQLLGSLRQIIGNGRCFGSIVWTNAVGILNGFINNEPTSFAIIAEAGLSKGLLEAVTGSPLGEIINAILVMVVRVGYLCKTKAEKDRAGAKLWEHDSAGNVIALGAASSSPSDAKGKGKAVDSGSDIEMHDADDTTSTPVSTKEPDISMTPYITSVASFLATVLNNSSVRSEFCARGGIEYVLDLAESQSLPANFGDGISSRNLQNVIALLAEQKPYLVIPSLLKRAQAAADVLEPFAKHYFSTSFFAPFVDTQSLEHADDKILAQGTAFAKAFVNVHSLVANLTASIQGSPYSHRNTPSGFNAMNFADHYNRLIQTLGPLLGASLKEEILLQRLVPKSWQQIPSARIKDNGTSDMIPDTVVNTEAPPPAANVSTSNVEPDSSSPSVDVTALPVALQTELANANSTSDTPTKPVSQSAQNASELQSLGALNNSAQFRNFGTLRYLLGRMPRVIGPFFQNVGKVLLSRRNPDPYYRQNHTTIAEALSESVLKQLARPGDDNSIDNYSYWIGLLHVLKDMFVDSSRHADRQIQTISIVLQAFKERSGFTTLNRILEAFTSEIRAGKDHSSEQQGESKTPEKTMKFELATIGAKQILSLYAILVNSKHIIEVPQTVAMIPRSERDRDRSRSDSFTPGQFVVELRMAILPTVRGLWESDMIEKAPSQISEKLIEVIRTIASTEGETGAVKRTTESQSARQPKSLRKAFKINSDSVTTLKEQGYDEDLAKEALYRCFNNLTNSTDYCKEHKRERTRGRCPIPDDDIEVAPEPVGNSRPSSGSTGTASPNEQSIATNPTQTDVTAIINSLQTVATAPTSDQTGAPEPANDPFTPLGFNRMMNQIVPGYENGAGSSAPRESPSLKPTLSTKVEEPSFKKVTVDDLNDERKLIRDNLIDKCLDVINAHGDVTFEISDLITTVVNKSPDHSGLRKIVAETLVVALMSFAGAEDVRTEGNKIAAYAHLLALMLREKQFYAAALGELKENLPTLLSFVKLSPSHSTEEPSPWIAQILLIVEMLLSEDAKPRKAKWTPPKDENEKVVAPVLEHVELAVSDEERSQLLESILDILPRIGREESLALAVLRILVILTRTRSVAQGMGEKKNIQRLFVMAKQLAGASSTRIHSPLLLILRHIVEDDETIKQIMRSDIKAFFDHNVRPQRSPVDLQLYLRGLQHLANRAPTLFVQVTNEMVKFTGWPFPSSEPTARAPSLVLKGDPPSESPSTAKVSEDAVQPTVQATEDLTLQDLKPSTEVIDTDMPDVAKAVSPEYKTPVVENPDGVIHFLLCELLNYKDVEDKDRPTTSHADKPTSTEHADVTMVGAPSVPDSPAPKDGQSTPDSTKQEFKGEEHPIYIYRCFLLQCLTELLAAYNRTKIEFINFKRSAPPQAMTPSKPRSSVLHYLLADLLPIGTLDYPETTTIRKKLTTSHWADSVITALLNKTGEQILDKLREQSDGEDEPDLLFVRRFVLENILKAYKDASASTEPLEIKYARMLSLADLMMHIMTGKENLGTADTSVSKRSQMQLKRIMYEKGYIAALTASVADIDLNFPGAKRAVKYILRPLKQLTHHAIYLSENALISSLPGQADDDDIESATSVSDLEDDREETPDLFRNSTLGMFEQGEEGDTSSDSEDGKFKQLS